MGIGPRSRRAILLKGASVTDLGFDLGALLVFAVGIVTLSALRFRKRLS